MKLSDNRKELSVDWLTVTIWALLVFAGWLNIYAASIDLKMEETSIFDFSLSYGKQFIWILIAVVIAFVIMILDTKLLEFLSIPLYIITLISCVAVMFLGREINGARAWFQIGSFGIQPSEFMKITTAMTLATYISRLNFNMENIWHRLTCLMIIFVPAGIVLLQNDTGSALVFIAFSLVLFREGLPLIYLLAPTYFGLLALLALIVNEYVLIFCVLALVISSWFFVFKKKLWLAHIGVILISALAVFGTDLVINKVLEPHQRERIYALFNPNSDPLGNGWNITQSKIAIGSGGVFGKGYLKGTQTKFDFVPEQDTDFIFCTIGEEHGWVGSILLLGVWFFLFRRIIYLAEHSKSKYARIYGYGVFSVLFFHLTVNVGMTIGLLPVIGIPLPFFSYGGSSLFAFTILLFLLLNHYTYRVNILSS